MTLDILDVDYEYKEVDFEAGEHLSPDYVKMNPMHNVPFLVVDGDSFSLNESSACMTYLVEQFGGESHFLYPLDRFQAKNVINQRLYFFVSHLWPKTIDYIVRNFI